MNPLHPTVPVEIGGHQYTLRYEYRDYAKAEGRLKMALVGPRSMQFWADDGDAYKAAVLLFVGLMNCERRVLSALGSTAISLSLDDVMGMIDYDTAPAIEFAVAEALEKFMPQLQKQEAAATDTPLAPKTPETETTGTISTPSPAPASA